MVPRLIVGVGCRRQRVGWHYVLTQVTPALSGERHRNLWSWLIYNSSPPRRAHVTGVRETGRRRRGKSQRARYVAQSLLIGNARRDHIRAARDRPPRQPQPADPRASGGSVHPRQRPRRAAQWRTYRGGFDGPTAAPSGDSRPSRLHGRALSVAVAGSPVATISQTFPATTPT